ncbi:hypothetical protein [Xenophilus sp. Marseille-Q4582]|uniref:hypothetical protein n=1 Tax=Xenophilus sp. Marseille-Q4582 TaxID=2866600 RepID=UPI001CE3E885|nr:hypothetical protein [Xenophilus sp. Marseille-Q4582]
MALTVTLQDYPHGHVDAIVQAIHRFRRELDRRLGDRLEDAVRAYQKVAASPTERVSPDMLRLASDWSAAYEAASAAGLEKLPELGAAYFEVRLS